MRERHFPRVCHACGSPMARQEETCWRCGTRWASEGVPPARLQVIAGGAAAAHADADRWLNDGGSVAAESASRARVS